MLYPCMCQQQICPSYATYAIYFVCRYETTMSMCKITAMNNVTRSIGIHVFNIVVYSPVQICLPHCTNMSPCTSTGTYLLTPHCCTLPSKINKLQHLFIIMLQNMYQPQICPSDAICMPSVQITWCALMGEVYQCICHAWTHWHQPYDKECCTETIPPPRITI